MKKRIMILGGYGGVGKVMSKNILIHTDSNIITSSHDLKNAEQFANILRLEYLNYYE
ncbi:MAG: hypothetical protein SFU98_08100 [Leptospiraceae bacterium]|nr:hypothetical protein [Leptospiraceae bacterium]